MSQRQIAVVGLGYVGLPLAVAFGKSRFAPVIGFDVNVARIVSLESLEDTTGEIDDDDLAAAKMKLSDDPRILQSANFIIVAVPTPITAAKTPDLTALESASRIVGENLRPGSIVVFESTVYPGVTENVCAPIIEKISGRQRGRDWKLGYSPERINPGDHDHTLERVVKVVSGEDAETLEIVAEVYGAVCTAGVHHAPSIMTAEAAKVIENTQRDLNIALVNELALIFNRLGLDTAAVLAAAGSKWNFHPYIPGLVGGHCIGVDPYYLTHLAERLGYHPHVILAGRQVNDEMGFHVADRVIQGLMSNGLVNGRGRVNVLGMTFKPNIQDTRNSRVVDVISRLKAYGLVVTAFDPMLCGNAPDFGQDATADSWENLAPADAAMLLVPHRPLVELAQDVPTLLDQVVRPGGIFFDLPRITDSGMAWRCGRTYLHL